jgi:hypothetical protein
MNEAKKLLQGSIKEFQDKINNASATPCTYLLGANGLSYILPGETSTDISCAFHVSTDQVQRPDGIYDVSVVEVNTQVELFSLFQTDSVSMIIITYNGLKIGVNKSAVYNGQMQTYHYFGEILQNKNSGYIITDDAVATELFLSNSTTKWIEFGTHSGVSVYPSFLTPFNKSTIHAIVEVKSSKAFSQPIQTTDTTILQYISDDCTIHLINATLNEAQKFLMALDTQAREKGFFGLMTIPGWVQVQDDTQSSFGIKANKRTMTIKINYVLESAADTALKYITKATANIAVTTLGGN